MKLERDQPGVDALGPTQMADEQRLVGGSGQVCEVNRVYAGQYLVHGQLGQGGMGEVYLVTHQMLKADFALKVLRPAFRSRPDIVTRFRAECRALWELSHPSFVKVHHAGDDPEIGPYIVMEVLKGITLQQLIARNERLSVRRALPIAIEIAKAADAMHELGIIHRDLKPENIFMPSGSGERGEPASKTLRVKLLDLGVAKIAKYGDPATAEHNSIGTGRYMSPEHIQCKPLGPPSDVYSLAHIVFEMLTGQHAFGQHNKNPTHYDFQIWHVNAKPHPLIGRLSTAPAELSDALMQAMAKDPAHRFQSMKAFAAALEESLRRVEVPARGGTALMQQEMSQESSKDQIVAMIREVAAQNAGGPWYFPPALTEEARSRRALDTSTGEVRVPSPTDTIRDTQRASPPSEDPRSSQPEPPGGARNTDLRGTVRMELGAQPSHATEDIETLDTVPIDDLSASARAQLGVLRPRQAARVANGGTPFMGQQAKRAVPALQQAQRTTAPMQRKDERPMGPVPNATPPAAGWGNRPQTAPLTVRVPPVQGQSVPTISAPPSAKRRTRLGLWITIVVLTICATLGALAVARRAGLLGKASGAGGGMEVG